MLDVRHLTLQIKSKSQINKYIANKNKHKTRKEACRRHKRENKRKQCIDKLIEIEINVSMNVRNSFFFRITACKSLKCDASISNYLFSK